MFPNETIDYDDDSIKHAKKLFDRMKQALSDVACVSQYMCKQDVSTIRTLKIYELPDGISRLKRRPVPFIRISGRWVEKAGFLVGDCIQVVTINNMILIIPVSSPFAPEELEPE